MSIQDYTGLITSEHSDKPKFMAMVTKNAEVLVHLQSLFTQMVDVLDLDQATGFALDWIGQIVGIKRQVSITLQDVYFSWDDLDQDGWDFGIWESSTNPGTISVLPDDVYRTFIRAKIAANQWDGTLAGAYAIWDAVFPNLTILIQDNQDMTYDLAIVGGIIDSLTLALIIGGYIPLKPEGIRVTAYYIPKTAGPIFAWDIENNAAQGWDQGSWTTVVQPTNQ